MRKWTQPEVDALMAEIMDPKAVLLICGRHSYVASKTPPVPRGCKDCCQAHLWFVLANTPPHLRMERLEELERMTYDAVKAFERGEFDIELARHPEIHIEKDVIN